MGLKVRIAVLSGVLCLGLLSIGHSILANSGEPKGEGQGLREPPHHNPLPAAKPAKGANKEVSVVRLKLTSANTIVFRSPVTALSVGMTQQQLLVKDRALGDGEPIYLFLDTPGGDIISGNQLADMARGLGRPVHTITNFAASMGFNLVQRLDTRYILPSGTLMAHRARVEGVGGQVPGEFITAAETILTGVTKMERQNAARLGISFEDYTVLVKDEYWVSGDDAVKQGAADKLAVIACDDTLDGTKDEVVQTMFGPVAIVWANCPAVTQPLDVVFKGTSEQEKALKNAVGDYRDYNRLRRVVSGQTSPEPRLR